MPRSSSGNSPAEPDRPRRTVRRIAAAFLFGIVLVAAGFGLFLHEIERPGPLREEAVLEIAPGSGPGVIAHALARMGAVRHPLLFRLAARLSGLDRSLKAGEYALAPGQSVRSLLAMMHEGRVLLHRVTLSEGLTSRQIVAILEASEGLAGPASAIPPEGTLLPETYYYRRGETVDAVLARMHEAQNALLAALWPERTPGLPFSQPQEAIILASIVEKETGRPEERPLVASVFINRLKRGMRLQSDPTVIYGVTGGEPLGRPIRKSELAAESGYNTYRLDGLPPTPIANPGAAAIRATLMPAESDWLYFVADGTGGHVFAATLEAHNRNVAAWRARRRAIPSEAPDEGSNR